MLTSARRWLRGSETAAPSGPVDVVMAAVAIALLGFGIVMVYSASTVEATVSKATLYDTEYFLKRQAVYGLFALIAMAGLACFDYHRFKRLTYPILAVVTAMLLMCVLGLGHRGGGATRWLQLGPINIQPSEAAKLGLILWLAYSLAKKREKVKSFSVGMLPHLIMAGGLMLLCLRQPDFGGAVVLLFLTFTLLFVAGARL
ncbi:MAG TPA: FtsW/RodA/SpoVE family cell cycle protein, partial [Polyangiaceae bacterium]